jgi:hypothetical protein
MLIACIAVAGVAQAADSVVMQWNNAALQAVRNTRMGPPMVARALAVTHTCMYDAWAAYDAIAAGTRYGRSLRRPARERTVANEERAISYAAYRALADLFPTQRATLFDPLMVSLGYDPLDGSMNISTPAGIGNTVAQAVLDFRHQDGSNQLGNLAPGPYADYTGYQPVNTADTVNDPNKWQPFAIHNGTQFVIPRFMAPHWEKVIPFALPASHVLQPPLPAMYPGAGYEKQANDLIELNANLTDRQKMISEYWSDGPSSETPPGHWNLLAQWMVNRDHMSLDRQVKLFFILNNALMDAGIASWQCKLFYDYVRPITAIRFLKKGQQISAWAGPHQGTRLISGESWLPYQPATFISPPFAEYVSGHSTFSASSATVLALFTGSNRFGASATMAAGSSRIEPGTTPAQPVTLSWNTFSDAADEAGISRRYGGIHFEDGDLQGRSLGRKVGVLTWLKSMTYFTGLSAWR